MTENEVMMMIKNMIKSVKDPKDKAKIKSLLKKKKKGKKVEKKEKDVLFEMKQILRNFNPSVRVTLPFVTMKHLSRRGRTGLLYPSLLIKHITRVSYH